MTSDVESAMPNLGDQGRKLLIDFDAVEAELVSFDKCNNSLGLDVKMDVSVLEENSSFKILG